MIIILWSQCIILDTIDMPMDSAQFSFSVYIYIWSIHIYFHVTKHIITLAPIKINVDPPLTCMVFSRQLSWFARYAGDGAPVESDLCRHSDGDQDPAIFRSNMSILWLSFIKIPVFWSHECSYGNKVNLITLVLYCDTLSNC